MLGVRLVFVRSVRAVRVDVGPVELGPGVVRRFVPGEFHYDEGLTQRRRAASRRGEADGSDRVGRIQDAACQRFCHASGEPLRAQ